MFDRIKNPAFPDHTFFYGYIEFVNAVKLAILSPVRLDRI
jgi:hypothetical protein